MQTIYSTAAVLFLTSFALGGCLEAPEPRYGVNITGLALEPYSETVGIHPSRDVLSDPNNPFRDTGVGAETKWDILTSGGHVGGFYAWATLLAVQPMGEHQFYTAERLERIWENREASPYWLNQIRDMAIDGYQSVLDNFPDDRTFAPNGINSFRLATLAHNGITRLGGLVEGDWVMVQTPDGSEEAVRVSEIPYFADLDEEEE